MKLYREVLGAAWQHTIHRPGLWLFGFFATFVFGASGELDRYLRFMNSVVTDGHLLNAQSWLDGHWAIVISQVYTQLAAGNVSVWLYTVGLVVAGLLLILMMSISVGALIHSAKHSTESFTEAFTAGYKHWPQLLVLFVSAYLIVVALTLAVVTVVLNLTANLSFENSQLSVVLVAGIVFVPLVVGVSFLVRLAAITIVLDHVHLGTAVRRACQVFTKHWLIVLEMSIITFIIVGATSLVLLIGLVVIFLPFFVMIPMSGSSGDALIQLQDTVFFGQWLYLLVSFFSAALLTTWQWSAWTNLFETLRTGKPASSLVAFIRSVK